MNTAKSILRFAILIALASVAYVGILSLPSDSEPSHAKWVFTLIMSKVVGVAALLWLRCLYKHWKSADRLIAMYHRWSLKGSES